MQRILLWLIRVYQIALSPLLGPRCRYFPTCSRYAYLAIRQYGPGHGGRLALSRILRCHPWGGSGLDPVPLRYRYLKLYPCCQAFPVPPFGSGTKSGLV